MQRLLLFIQWICLFFLSTSSLSQNIKSPSSYLGYELGSQFTYHYKVQGYLSYLTNKSLKFKYIPYGKSIEGRDLFVLAISSEKNIKNLDEIRQSNLQRAGFIKGKPTYETPIVWLGYNVHGNEASGSEVAMKVAFELNAEKYSTLLEDIVVIIDPCLNPDGRDRYVNDFNGKQGVFLNAKPNTWEHIEKWPTGRFNHYLFDLNRDWAWQTQEETKQRTVLYKKWYPEVFIDFHEMMPQYSYFFGPSADPIHKEVTDWQKKYHRISSEKYQAFFKEQEWKFFTEKVFDLLYPSYGDSWTCFNGAVGFTFEQGGHGVAGLVYQKRKNGYEITLKGRIQKHFETSIITLLTASEYKKELLDQFEDFFNSNSKKVVSYVIRKNKNDEQNIKCLIRTLNAHNIIGEVAIENNRIKGYSYFDQKEGTYNLTKGDIVFSTNQKLGKALKVLLEPKAEFTDSTTYDLTAWSLPYALGLDVVETYDLINTKSLEKNEYEPTEIQVSHLTDSTFFLIQWESIADVRLIGELFQNDLKVGFFSETTELGNVKIEKGTIAFPYFGLMMSRKLEIFKEVLLKHKIQYDIISIPNIVSETKIEIMKKPSITILAGEGVNPVKFGSLWYFFDKVIQYPVDIIYKDRFTSFDLINSNVLILSDGIYDDKISELIKPFIEKGGKVILLERAIKVVSTIHELELSKKVNKDNRLKKKEKINDKALGCIIEVELPKDKFISTGLKSNYYLVKENSNTLPLLHHGNNLGIVNNSKAVSGFLGSDLSVTLKGKSLISSESYKKGEVYYFVDNPLLRGFWVNGMHLLSNTIFFPNE